MVVNRSAPKATVVPILVYEDVGQAVDWLCDAFGFRERLRAGRSGLATVLHAQLDIAECTVMLEPPRRRVSAATSQRSQPIRDRARRRCRPAFLACQAAWRAHREAAGWTCRLASVNTRRRTLGGTGGRSPSRSLTSRPEQWGATPAKEQVKAPPDGLLRFPGAVTRSRAIDLWLLERSFRTRRDCAEVVRSDAGMRRRCPRADARRMSRCVRGRRAIRLRQRLHRARQRRIFPWRPAGRIPPACWKAPASGCRHVKVRPGAVVDAVCH